MGEVWKASNRLLARPVGDQLNPLRRTGDVARIPEDVRDD
jgi:hypothetical protein